MPCFCGAPRRALAKSRPLPLLRLAYFCRRQRLGCAARRPLKPLALSRFLQRTAGMLAKTGALRQTQLPVSSAGRGRCVCPCRCGPAPSGGSMPVATPFFFRLFQTVRQRLCVLRCLYPEGAVCGSEPRQGRRRSRGGSAKGVGGRVKIIPLVGQEAFRQPIRRAGWPLQESLRP